MADAFRFAMLVGSTPPLPVLQWVASALQSWEDSDGKSDIGQLLGLKPTRGKRPVFEDFERIVRDAVLMLDMDCLIHLGCSREDAADIASHRAVHRWAAPCPSCETLLSMYAKRKDRPTVDHIAGIVGTEQDTREFLARFDPHYLTKTLKSML